VCVRVRVRVRVRVCVRACVRVCVMFGGRFFQQTVGIPVGSNCTLPLADLFHYSYEALSLSLK
jgi:hypothetical protein